ncbi:MAG: head decoration protein [Blastocatellia bacterium]
MGNGYGQTVVGNWGTSLRLSADGQPEMKAGGITVDWNTVPVVNAGADTTWDDGIVVPAGTKALRYGTVLTQITASGMWGPCDTTAVDGRQAGARGTVFLLDRSVLEDEVKSMYPPVLEGGLVWKDRILAGGANQMTFANLEAALPRLRYAAV